MDTDKTLAEKIRALNELPAPMRRKIARKARRHKIKHSFTRFLAHRPMWGGKLSDKPIEKLGAQKSMQWMDGFDLWIEKWKQARADSQTVRNV